jgi:hypothetical protein
MISTVEVVDAGYLVPEAIVAREEVRQELVQAGLEDHVDVLILQHDERFLGARD